MGGGVVHVQQENAPREAMGASFSDRPRDHVAVHGLK